MVLEAIYVVRHGYRLNWVVNPTTGTYHSNTPTPTGIPSDPQLASYGEQQAQHLADRVVNLDPSPGLIYSSPFYRCLQTIKPAVEAMTAAGKLLGKVRVENGISEFFGTARFDHPSPAKVPDLNEHFNFLDDSHQPSIIPSSNGETIPALHDRHAYALHRIIAAVDADPRGPRAILLCTHAASMICIGRVLTGRMPQSIDEHDFHCGTCALSKFDRRVVPTQQPDVAQWDPSTPELIPAIEWQNGKGVGGGWDCVLNGDCSHLPNGEERSWDFSMEVKQK